MSIIGNNEEKKSLNGKIVQIPTVDKTLSKSGYSADAKVTGDALKKKVNITDIVDNLTTDNANKPLSARQGAELKRRVDDIDPHFAENVNYDNTKSGFTAENVQDAIDEIKVKAVKPTGSYQGNGNATARIIYVGGTGGWLGVCSGSYMIGIITQNGAMFFNTTNSTVKCFPVSQVKYMSGNLTISSTDDFLNKNGSTYHFQVL